MNDYTKSKELGYDYLKNRIFNDNTLYGYEEILININEKVQKYFEQESFEYIIEIYNFNFLKDVFKEIILEYNKKFERFFKDENSKVLLESSECDLRLIVRKYETKEEYKKRLKQKEIKNKEQKNLLNILNL